MRAVWRTAWLALGAAVLGMSVAKADPAAEDFTRPPALDAASVSPGGDKLAVLVPGPGGWTRLAVLDLQPIGKPRIVADFDDADVREVHWVNGHRLVFSAFQRAAAVERGGGGIFAVNDDGSDQRQLVSWIWNTADVSNVAVSDKLLSYGWRLAGTIDDGSEDVMMSKYVVDNAGEPQGVQVSRLNTVTGVRHSLSYGLPERVYSWLTDATRQLRAAATYGKGREQIWWRDKADQPWQQVADFDELGPDSIQLWHLDPDGQVYVLARKGAATEGLFTFDPHTARISDTPVALLKGFDLDPERLVDSRTHKLVGLRFRTDASHTLWLDDRLAALQNGLDKALPGRSNTVLCTRCLGARFFVVLSQSDRQPGQYLLFDAKEGSIQPIGFERPWIDEAAQGRRTFHRIKARDGLDMPVYLTQPAHQAEGHLPPAVVVVHGGPFLRGVTTHWDAEAQFLASRGYVVIEPEFRGSTGYGWALFHAGWKQWGQRMQDDLADSVQWAAGQHLVDPSRVCVMGASYGGYAALMAPIATPGVFKCAISFAGVTDIDLMYSVTWSDVSEDWKRYGMPRLVGDRVADAQMLKKASPLNRAAEIKVPVLLAHGGDDRRVPLAHERAFASAARAAGVSLEEWIYAEEGHGFYKPEDHADYLRHVEAFLSKHIGSSP